jgi:hypothetical protein
MQNARSFGHFHQSTVFVLPKKKKGARTHCAMHRNLAYYYYTIFLVGEGTCASQGLKDPESPGGSDLRDASRKVWQLGVTEE